MGSRINAEFAFVTGGLLVASMGWAADLFGVMSGGGGESHGAGELFFRVNITIFALGLAAIGVGYEQHARILREPPWGLRYVAGYLILADGLLHGYAFNDHLGEPFPAGFFAVVALVQVAVGLGLPYLRRTFDVAWLALTGFLIAAYAATRSVVVWPLGEVEELEGLGLLSKVIEVLAVLSLVQLIRADRRARRIGPATAPASSGDP